MEVQVALHGTVLKGSSLQKPFIGVILGLETKGETMFSQKTKQAVSVPSLR